MQILNIFHLYNVTVLQKCRDNIEKLITKERKRRKNENSLITFCFFFTEF